jgi:hypothetical protein
MGRLTLISLSALLAAALASPAFAAGSGMGARDKPAAQMGEMGPHHHAHHRHYHHRYAGDSVTRQLNAQEYASHMMPAAPPPPRPPGFQPLGTNAFQQGYTTPPLSTPAVNTAR